MNPDSGQVLAAILACVVAALTGYGIGYRRGRENEYKRSFETINILRAQLDGRGKWIESTALRLVPSSGGNR